MDDSRIALDLDLSPVAREITKFLRNPDSGRLDALRIARLYRLPVRRFAGLLGGPVAAIRRCPDHEAFQAMLAPFEQVARILGVIADQEAFAQWAKSPNSELEGAAPVDVLLGPHKVPELARLVEGIEEVLVGQPD